ncbi:MAG: putative sulfite oxidase subunit YedZ [Osedax symbiont Rs1]|nr:MAG: putative sulfite oxidase subunit YedZ [Osedax symbiont Rs1]
MDLTNKSRQRLYWWLIFCTALLPLSLLTIAAFTQQLGADPAKEIVQELGTWAINLLWITLAISPLRKLCRWQWLAKYRRMLGLYSFFYAMLHLLAFATFIVGWDIEYLIVEVTKRPYAIVGFIAILLLVPLAVTSTKRMQQRLKKRWLILHKLIYVISILALLHIVWQIRSDFFEALVYGLLLCWLLGYRYLHYRQSKIIDRPVKSN